MTNPTRKGKRKVAMRVGCIVYDSWWLWRIGRVTKISASRLHVQWSDGETWNYDKAHQQFLRRTKR